MGLYEEVGLEAFSYYLADCPGVIIETMEQNTLSAERWFRNLPADHGRNRERGELGCGIHRPCKGAEGELPEPAPTACCGYC